MPQSPGRKAVRARHLGARAMLAALPWCVVVVLASVSHVAARGHAVRVDVVEKKYQRCGRHLERVNEQLEQLGERIESLAELAESADMQRTDKTRTLVRTTRTKLTRLRSRFDRAQSQSNRISGEINRYKGNGQGCPDCLLSDVTMLCRHAEALLAETADLRRELRRYETGTRRRENTLAHMRQTDTLIAAAEKEATAEAKPLQRARALQQQAREAYAEKDYLGALEYTLKARKVLGSEHSRDETGGDLTRQAQALTERIEAIRAAPAAKDDHGATVVVTKAAEHIATARKLIVEGRGEKAAAELTVAERLVAIAEAKAKRR